MSTRTSRSNPGSPERGVAIVIVVFVLTLFLALGGVALKLTAAMAEGQRNQQYALQAKLTADGGVNSAVAVLMDTTHYANLSDAVAAIGTGLRDLTLQTSVAPADSDILADAVVEGPLVAPAPANAYRIYARGRSWRLTALGEAPTATSFKTARFVRAYVTFTATDTSRKVTLVDWQEVTKDEIKAHANGLAMSDDTEPKKTYLAWVQ